MQTRHFWGCLGLQSSVQPRKKGVLLWCNEGQISEKVRKIERSLCLQENKKQLRLNLRCLELLYCMITMKRKTKSTNCLVTTLLGLSIDCCLEKYFLPNLASDYQTFTEINDHQNVYFIHLPPCIERMSNLYSTYLKKTHLYKFFVSNCVLKWGIKCGLTCDVDLNPLS